MKKGFTLIELLAVIVILAIIALIATPIILGIISDAKKQANERSIEQYANALRNAVASEQTKGKIITGIEDITPDDMKKYYDGDVTCDITEIHEDGTIYLAECSVNGELVDGYTYGEKQPICTKVSDVATSTDASILYEAGDKYTCKVDPNKEAYTFFILNTVANDAASINLISEANIDSTGTPIKTNDAPKSLVTWDSSGRTMGGPTTAMNFLQQATSSWTNLENINMNYTDEGNQYGGIKTTENITKITKINGEETSSYTNLKARLPYKSELNAVGCTGSINSCPLWIVNYLIDGDQPYQGRTEINDIYGFWALSASSSSYDALRVRYNGHFGPSGAINGDIYGVRPVINIKI